MRLVRYTYPHRSFAPAFGAFSRSPWSGLESEIDRLFETALGDLNGSSAANRFPVDLFEDKENTYVRAELPGVNRDDINVEVVDGYLTIAATRKTPAAAGQESPSASADAGQAASAGSGQAVSFSRSVSLNDDVQADKVSASYENGVLTVTLPKREEAKPKKITVAVK